MKTRIIAIEGINGIGKTEAIRNCRPHLDVHQTNFWFGHELQDGIGLQFREMLHRGTELTPPAMALLFASARIDSYTRRCREHPDGAVLVYDRFLWSSLSYHSVRCDPLWVRGINQHSPAADLNILLDADPKLLTRREDRTKLPKMFPKDAEFLQQVRENFLDLVRQNPGHAVVLDAMQPPGELARRMADEIHKFVARV